MKHIDKIVSIELAVFFKCMHIRLVYTVSMFLDQHRKTAALAKHKGSCTSCAYFMKQIMVFKQELTQQNEIAI